LNKASGATGKAITGIRKGYWRYLETPDGNGKRVERSAHNNDDFQVTTNFSVSMLFLIAPRLESQRLTRVANTYTSGCGH